MRFKIFISNKQHKIHLAFYSARAPLLIYNRQRDGEFIC